MTGAIGVLIVWPTRAPIFACLTEIKPATKIVLLVGSVQQTKLFAHTPSETSGTGISLTSAATKGAGLTDAQELYAGHHA